MACQEALKETNKVKRLFYFVKRALRCIASQQAKTGLPPQHEKPARAGGPGLLGAAAREPAAQGKICLHAYPALIPQRAIAPRKRTGLLPTVPGGTGATIGYRSFVTYEIPQGRRRLESFTLMF